MKLGSVQIVDERKPGFPAPFKIHRSFLFNCPGGEIGRRTVFRSQRSQGCAGSNPVLGTRPFVKICNAMIYKRFFISGNAMNDISRHILTRCGNLFDKSLLNIKNGDKTTIMNLLKKINLKKLLTKEGKLFFLPARMGTKKR